MEKNNKIVHTFSEGQSPGLFTKTLPFLMLLIGAGIVTGYILSTTTSTSKVKNSQEDAGIPQMIEKGNTIGSSDTSKFKDQAEGVLKVGGINGEGAFHLERPGGPSQYVYLTSSVLDLSSFVDKKIRVWGETNSAKKAGWLMDVGRVQLLE